MNNALRSHLSEGGQNDINARSYRKRAATNPQADSIHQKSCNLFSSVASKYQLHKKRS